MTSSFDFSSPVFGGLGDTLNGLKAPQSLKSKDVLLAPLNREDP